MFGTVNGVFRRAELLGDELPEAVKIPVHFKTGTGNRLVSSVSDMSEYKRDA